MPDLARDPDWRDVEGLMRSAGYWPADNEPVKQSLAREQAATGAVAAVSEWKRATGWYPFHVSPTAPHTTREFDWEDNAVVTFDSGLLELGSITLNGQLVPASAYRLLPRNALSTERPYQALAWAPQFQRMRARRGRFQVVEVTARWGFCTLYPGDVWQQILQAAGLVTLTQVENLQSIASLSMEAFSKALDVVGIITQKDTAERWKREFPKSCERWKRTVT